MAALSVLLITVSSVMDNHFAIIRSEDLHQEAYYLAETGVNSAIRELTRIIEQVHGKCLSDFEWDPLSQPLRSLQESADQHIADELGPKLKSELAELGYSTVAADFPVPIMPGMPSESDIDVKIYFSRFLSDPSVIRIISRGTIGNIKRRIDACLNINKVSQLYDSSLFRMAFLSGEGVEIDGSATLQADGRIYSQGRIRADEQSTLDIQDDIFTKQDIVVQNGSSASFSKDVVCGSITTSGEGSRVTCLEDVYAYHTIEAYGPEDSILIKGDLYITPDDMDSSAGVTAGNEAEIILEDDFFVNGTVIYPAEEEFLFHLEEIPLSDGFFFSNESMGGNNGAFYFPEAVSEYAKKFFGPDYLSLEERERTNRLQEYLTVPPESETDRPAYENHIRFLDKNSIHLRKDDPESGYAPGLIFADNQVINRSDPNRLPQVPEEFFRDILYEMEKQASWDYKKQLNQSVPVPSCNVLPEGASFSLPDPASPFVYVLPEEKDITLPSGEYSGILFTNGSIRIEQGEHVSFRGLMISGKKLVVEGDLTLKEDKKLLLRLLEEQGEPLRSFFRIRKEKPLVEIQSFREHNFNEKIQ
jgi:hypothetical protein